MDEGGGEAGSSGAACLTVACLTTLALPRLRLHSKPGEELVVTRVG